MQIDEVILFVVGIYEQLGCYLAEKRAADAELSSAVGFVFDVVSANDEYRERPALIPTTSASLKHRSVIRVIEAEECLACAKAVKRSLERFNAAACAEPKVVVLCIYVALADVAEILLGIEKTESVHVNPYF